MTVLGDCPGARCRSIDNDERLTLQHAGQGIRYIIGDIHFAWQSHDGAVG